LTDIKLHSFSRKIPVCAIVTNKISNPERITNVWYNDELRVNESTTPYAQRYTKQAVAT
jgi:hypothetical protein